MVRLGTKMWLWIALPAVLIAGAVFAAAQIQRSAALHSARAIEQQQLMLTAMLDQETGARGFFQTRDQVFLQPWYKGSTGFEAALAASRALDAGDAALDQDLDVEERLANSWHASAAAAITMTQRLGRLPSVSSALARKSVMDSFRDANAKLAADLVSRRNRDLTTASVIGVVLAAGLSLGLALAAVLLLRLAGQRDRARRRTERELRELLQVSETESESRTLLIRHIERMVPGAGAAVLNRNNSDDRLEPCLSPSDRAGDAEAHESPLRDLPQEHLLPRSCLAVRLSRSYERRRDEQTLAQCEVCGKLAADVACEPLLVGGQVIGSVLVAREGQISSTDHTRVRDAVIQAAPIIANQRNLSLAETRAASDSLTGLPNRRSADDTIKRMCAHSSRSVSPLSAILIDLDHFKQINDIHGHEVGDEALAAVGGILSSTLRGSDFASRFGGEEFLVLLPDTDMEQARLVAEKLRAAVVAADLRSGKLTASFGVATFPSDAVDPEELLRKADRALYAAKRGGRNRVELASAAAALTASDPGAEPPVE